MHICTFVFFPKMAVFTLDFLIFDHLFLAPDAHFHPPKDHLVNFLLDLVRERIKRLISLFQVAFSHAKLSPPKKLPTAPGDDSSSFLNRHLAALNLNLDNSELFEAAKKMAIEQLVFAPLINTVFMLSSGLLEPSSRSGKAGFDRIWKIACARASEAA